MTDQPEASAENTPHAPLTHLLSVLELSYHGAETGEDVYSGASMHQPNGRVYGGQVLAQALLAAGATVDNAKRSLQQSTDQVAGQLIIGVTSLVAGYYLADLLTRFQRAYPNVEIRVMEDERPYIEHLLVSGEIDVGVLILSNLEDRHALQTEVLTHSPHRLWLPAQHPLLEHDSINLADVAREPLIQLNVDEMGHNAQRLWAGAGLQPRVTLRTASTEAVRSLVAAGLGVSIQPDMTYRPWSLEGDIIEARPIADLSQTLDVGLAWRRGTARPALVDPFLTVAREQPHPRKPSI